ncbi:GNAT family N-acetyltransferase [Pelagicoccus mobilis]|uniref:GNAT family N-acetyltransferase n=1 Tax=Pelagicoccus mobilis TaxID=415221 RepID=A0A934RTV8_9BACT|nr:GNAT family N-acetyltransferase [Pelagicoccus mobilis]MBK1876782.1 GNAT family N-acetyltransferase [Pelagicoccus mobilis]
MQVAFKPSQPEEAKILSEIAVRSKGYWGYSQEQLELWREGLSTSPEYIAANSVRSIWHGQQIVGYFSIVKSSPPLLDNLWLLPEVIGKGVGKQALTEIKTLAAQLGLSELIIISDPDAEGFYLHHGAIRIGEHPSIPQGRMLPKLRLTIGRA